MKKYKKKLLTASILVTTSTIAMHAINRIISTSAVIKNLLSTDKGSYYSWRFGKVFYTKSGEGKPLLLIHDLTSASSNYEWKKIIPVLEKHYTVYTLDLLGCGRSDKPKITYTNFLYVQLITDFVKHVIHKKTDVIVSGLSTSFAIMACFNDDTIFNKLMLISPEDLSVLNKTPNRQSKIAKFLLEIPILGTTVYYILNGHPNIELLFTEKYFFNPFHLNNLSVNTYYEAAHRENGNGKYLQASISGRYIYCNITHALKEINNSIFLLSGEKKKDIQETFSLYTSLNPSIETDLIPKTAHLPHLENPEKIIETISIFFDNQS